MPFKLKLLLWCANIQNQVGGRQTMKAQKTTGKNLKIFKGKNVQGSALQSPISC